MENKIKSMGFGDEAGVRAEFGEEAMKNYKHLPNTIIFKDSNGNPVGISNEDGTWSGISFESLGIKRNDNSSTP